MRFSTCAIALALMTTASAATAQTPPSCGPVNLSSVGGSADLNICDADAFLTSVASGTVSGAWVEPTDSAYLLEGEFSALDLGELPGFGDWQGLISGTYSSRYDEDLNLIGVSTSWSVDELIAPPQRIELLAGLALSIRQATNFGATTGSAEFADGVARIEHLDSTGPDIALNIDSGTANISPSYRLTGLDLTVGLVLGQSWVDGNSLQPLLDAIPLLATGCEDNTCRFRFSGNPSRPTVAAALQ